MHLITLYMDSYGSLGKRREVSMSQSAIPAQPITGPTEDCSDCYLVTMKYENEQPFCSKCLIGHLVGENTLLLPRVLLGTNAPKVLSVLGFINFNSFSQGVFYFNFERVECIDSGGLGALILAKKKVIPKDVEICFINIQPNIYRVFSMSNLNKLFMLKKA
tara:strand:- start:39 stop:521 length:483 start_codon:yes stop_codon:yes gene_type:complete